MLLVVNVPAEELFYMAAKYFIIMFCILMLIGIFINALLYLVLDRNMSKPIDKLIRIANKIRKGELDTEIKLEKPEEFANLASTFDKMANDIKNITKEREKIESELTLAKTIQESSVPNKFPAYPDRTEFDIYAKMYPAKEVGGDFYDFYFTDEENFMFLIADVSGKGVPAALSMMNIITLINVTAHLKYSPSEMFDYINKKVCANSRGLFVTLFACIVNINTGKLTCINCGHNHPLLKQNGKYNYLKTDANIVLGAFPDAVFNIYETTLNKDDEIFLYTDGVTEAHNAESEMYGEERLLNTLNNYTNSNLANVIANVKSDLKNFIQNMPQYDYTTMLIFRYKKDNTSSNIFRSKAEKENYSDFRNWVNKICDEWDLAAEIKMKLNLIAEEIFVNIISYAYKDKTGDVEVEFNKDNSVVTFKFIDSGIPYNPLEKDDPDIDISADERQIGGLGIFMVKQYANECHYEYKDDRNILSVKVYLD